MTVEELKGYVYVCGEVTETVEVLPLAVAGFDYAVTGLTAVFTNTSVNADTYLWDFGDGVTSTETSPSHEYAEAGEYVITLTADGVCNTDVVTMTVTVSGGFPFVWFPLVQKDVAAGDR